jgi:uncharacterized RDD family membrane protein YckC
MAKRSFQITDDCIASQTQRFGNYVIDMIMIYVFIFIILLFVAIIGGFTGNSQIITWLQNIPLVHSWLIAIVTLILYYGISETLLARSLAKFMTKTQVVMIDGSKPDEIVILKRTLCRLIPFDHFSFFNTPSRGWHDSISDTYVVDKSRFEEALRIFNMPEADDLTVNPEPISNPTI